jgi:hypothetical protein
MLWVVMALGVGLQADTPPPVAVPTAIEQALAEYRCGMAAGGAPGASAYDVCLAAQFSTLRADFGRDLSRLSPGERRTIDATCNKVPASVDREAYVKCLSDQLVALRARRGRANPPPAAAAPAPADAAAPAAAPAVAQPQTAERPLALWIGIAAAVLVVVGGGLFFALKGRSKKHKCRTCGQDVVGSGDLCQKCRHEAAEALRSAATQRADQERAQQDEVRRQREQEEERALQKAQQQEEARLREQERVRQEEKARRDEDQRQQEEAEARRRRQAGEEAAETLDPYAVLGVPRDATADAIRKAYDEMKAKYAPDLVDGMSPELQEHFKTKAAAVERAYQALAIS